MVKYHTGNISFTLKVILEALKVGLVCVYICRQWSVFPNNSDKIYFIKPKIVLPYHIKSIFDTPYFRSLGLQDLIPTGRIQIRVGSLFLASFYYMLIWTGPTFILYQTYILSNIFAQCNTIYHTTYHSIFSPVCRFARVSSLEVKYNKSRM